MFTAVCPIHEMQISHDNQARVQSCRISTCLLDNAMQSEYLPLCSTSLFEVWKWTALFIPSKPHSYLDYQWICYCVGLNSAANDHSQKQDAGVGGLKVTLCQKTFTFTIMSMLLKNWIGPFCSCRWIQILIAQNFRNGSCLKVVLARAVPWLSRYYITAVSRELKFPQVLSCGLSVTYLLTWKHKFKKNVIHKKSLIICDISSIMS